MGDLNIKYTREQKGLLKCATSNKYFALFSGTNTVGRNKTATVTIKSLNVSHHHAIIIYLNEKWYISDLDSSNGTYINNKKLKPFVLYEVKINNICNQIKFGDYVSELYNDLIDNPLSETQNETQNFTQGFFNADTQLTYDLSTDAPNNDRNLIYDIHDAPTQVVELNPELCFTQNFHEAATQVINLEEIELASRTSTSKEESCEVSPFKVPPPQITIKQIFQNHNNNVTEPKSSVEEISAKPDVKLLKDTNISHILCELSSNNPPSTSNSSLANERSETLQTKNSEDLAQKEAFVTELDRSDEEVDELSRKLIEKTLQDSEASTSKQSLIKERNLEETAKTTKQQDLNVNSVASKPELQNDLCSSDEEINDISEKLIEQDVKNHEANTNEATASKSIKQTSVVNNNFENPLVPDKSTPVNQGQTASDDEATDIETDIKPDDSDNDLTDIDEDATQVTTNVVHAQHSSKSNSPVFHLNETSVEMNPKNLLESDSDSDEVVAFKKKPVCVIFSQSGENSDASGSDGFIVRRKCVPLSCTQEEGADDLNATHAHDLDDTTNDDCIPATQDIPIKLTLATTTKLSNSNENSNDSSENFKLGLTEMMLSEKEDTSQPPRQQKKNSSFFVPETQTEKYESPSSVTNRKSLDDDDFVDISSSFTLQLADKSAELFNTPKQIASIVTGTDEDIFMQSTQNLELDMSKPQYVEVNAEIKATEASSTIRATDINRCEDIFLQPTQKLDESVNPSEEDNSFLQPTQPLSIVNSSGEFEGIKQVQNTKESVDDSVFMQPTQLLSTNVRTLEANASDDSVFLQPTQPLQRFSTRKHKTMSKPGTSKDPDPETDDESLFLQPTQILDSVGDSCRHKEDDDSIFMQPTQIITQDDNPQILENVADDSELPNTGEGIKDVFLQPTQVLAVNGPNETLFLNDTQPKASDFDFNMPKYKSSTVFQQRNDDKLDIFDEPTQQITMEDSEIKQHSTAQEPSNRTSTELLQFRLATGKALEELECTIKEIDSPKCDDSKKCATASSDKRFNFKKTSTNVAITRLSDISPRRDETLSQIESFIMATAKDPKEESSRVETVNQNEDCSNNKTPSRSSRSLRSFTSWTVCDVATTSKEDQEVAELTEKAGAELSSITKRTTIRQRSKSPGSGENDELEQKGSSRKLKTIPKNDSNKTKQKSTERKPNKDDDDSKHAATKRIAENLQSARSNTESPILKGKSNRESTSSENNDTTKPAKTKSLESIVEDVKVSEKSKSIRNKSNQTKESVGKSSNHDDSERTASASVTENSSARKETSATRRTRKSSTSSENNDTTKPASSKSLENIVEDVNVSEKSNPIRKKSNRTKESVDKSSKHVDLERITASASENNDTIKPKNTKTLETTVEGAKVSEKSKVIRKQSNRTKESVSDETVDNFLNQDKSSNTTENLTETSRRTARNKPLLREDVGSSESKRNHNEEFEENVGRNKAGSKGVAELESKEELSNGKVELAGKQNKDCSTKTVESETKRVTNKRNQKKTENKENPENIESKQVSDNNEIQCVSKAGEGTKIVRKPSARQLSKEKACLDEKENDRSVPNSGESKISGRGAARKKSSTAIEQSKEELMQQNNESKSKTRRLAKTDEVEAKNASETIPVSVRNARKKAVRCELVEEKSTKVEIVPKSDPSSSVLSEVRPTRKRKLSPKVIEQYNGDNTNVVAKKVAGNRSTKRGRSKHSDEEDDESVASSKVLRIDETDTSWASCSSTPRKQRLVADEAALLSSAERTKRKQRPKVVFTMLDSPQLESYIKQLGGRVVDSIEDATVLVTPHVKRTQKLLQAVGMGKPICGPSWIESSKKSHEFLDPWDYILIDKEAEKNWKFSLKESLIRSSHVKLLEGFVFQIIVNQAGDVLKGAIEGCGGKCVTKHPGKNGSADEKYFIVSTKDHKGKYARLLKQYPDVKVIQPEAIFDGVLRQELHFDQHYVN